jgi:transcriptional regulator with XRE-family HTH domain
MPTPEDLGRLGTCLRERREQLGLRKSDVARRIGVTPSYVTLIEDATPRRQGRGKPTQPSRDVLAAWVRVLDLDQAAAAWALSWSRAVSMGQGSVQSDRVTSQRDYDRAPWPARQELLLEQVRELLRLAERSPNREELADLLTKVCELVRFRLLHESTD